MLYETLGTIRKTLCLFGEQFLFLVYLLKTYMWNCVCMFVPHDYVYTTSNGILSEQYNNKNYKKKKKEVFIYIHGASFTFYIHHHITIYIYKKKR